MFEKDEIMSIQYYYYYNYYYYITMGISLEGSILAAPIKEIHPYPRFLKSLILADDPPKKKPLTGTEPAVFATARDTGRPTF